MLSNINQNVTIFTGYMLNVDSHASQRGINISYVRLHCKLWLLLARAIGSGCKSCHKIIRPFRIYLFISFMKNSDHNTEQKRLMALREEHKRLNDLIAKLEADTMPDQLQIRRLKKQKLSLKDAIVKLEDRLMPDIIA